MEKVEKYVNKAEKVAKYAWESEKKVKKYACSSQNRRNMQKHVELKKTGFGISVVWNAQIPKGMSFRL